jgi:ornithine cyclodeaminase/alanine dehydrogenase-like protein (mu-crystallin family)
MRTALSRAWACSAAGLINHEITRFPLAVFPGLDTLVVHDVAPERAARFGRECERLRPGLKTEVALRANDVLAGAALVSFATTAATPHVRDLTACAQGTTILHVSLRGLAPAAIPAADNVDDVDPVCRAQTPVHLAEQTVGHRRFIRCTLAAITSGTAERRPHLDRATVFSPFGLGVLELALGELVYALVQKQGGGVRVDSFFPRPWMEREDPALPA